MGNKRYLDCKNIKRDYYRFPIRKIEFIETNEHGDYVIGTLRVQLCLLDSCAKAICFNHLSTKPGWIYIN